MSDTPRRPSYRYLADPVEERRRRRLQRQERLTDLAWDVMAQALGTVAAGALLFGLAVVTGVIKDAPPDDVVIIISALPGLVIPTIFYLFVGRQRSHAPRSVMEEYYLARLAELDGKTLEDDVT